jgi:hypothetical protein
MLYLYLGEAGRGVIFPFSYVPVYGQGGRDGGASVRSDHLFMVAILRILWLYNPIH